MHGAEACNVRAVFEDAAGRREQMIALSASEQLVRVDGQKPESLAAYAVRTPVVVFHPGEMSLTMGTASVRRTLLDRVSLFLDPSSLAAHRAYARAMKARQKLLETEGLRGKGIEVWERLMAEHGAKLTSVRRLACEKLNAATTEAFRAMAPATVRMQIRYAASGSEDIEAILQRLRDGRDKDLRRASAGFGPHRDDLAIALSGRPARVVASQGQHRLMTLSLKVAELACVAEGAGCRPILLLDDVSSELDGGRIDAFFELLGSRHDQVFMTTARPEILIGLERSMGEAMLFEVVGGEVLRRSG